MITKIALVVSILLLSSCGGGGGQNNSTDDSPASSPPPRPAPDQITGDVPVEIDALAVPVIDIDNGTTRYFSFVSAKATAYRITLQSISGNANFTLRDAAELTSSTIVGQSASANSVEVLSFSADGDKKMYLAISSTENSTSFKLFINTESTIANRAKIFVSSEKHNGNLAADRALAGNNAIEKADYICNTSVAKPDNAQYKALLVDGLYRDAINQTDWVLQPEQRYFRRDGVIPVGTTNTSAQFSPDAKVWAGLLLHNAVEDCNDCDPSQQLAWTGIADTTDLFSFYFSNCGGWATTAVDASGTYGIYIASDYDALHSTAGDCSHAHAFYCVQQPQAEQSL